MEYRRTSTNQPNHMSACDFRLAVGLVLLAIIYGSLYPLTWDFDHPRDFIVQGPLTLIDAAENIILFLPLGWFLACYYHGQPYYGFRFATWFIIALVVAGCLQWLQKYLPRTPALSDFVFNMVGHVAGWWLGMISKATLDRILQRHVEFHFVDRFALFMIGVWLVAELFPLIPTFDVSSVLQNVKSLWRQDAWQPRRMVLHLGITVIGLEALAHFVRSALSGPLVQRRLVGIATLGILAGKFIVVGQSPGLPVAFGILGGALVWMWIDFREESQKLTMLMVVASGTYLVDAIWPLAWRDPPRAMQWMPFASSLSNSIEAVIPSMAFECLCFGAIIWCGVRNGALLRGLTFCTVVLAFACEWTQRYLPTRTPEITSALLALGMGWLVATLGQTEQRKKG